MPALAIRKLNMEYVFKKPVLRGIGLDIEGYGFTPVIGIAEGTVEYDRPPSGLSDEQLKAIYGGQNWLH